MQQQLDTVPHMQDLGGVSATAANTANRQPGMTFTAETMHSLLQQIAANNVYRQDAGMKDGDIVDRKGGISDLVIDNVPQDITKRLKWVERLN